MGDEELLRSAGLILKDDEKQREGINSVSARDKILRKIFSNLLAHRDYSSAYVAKFVIEKQSMYTENASREHGFGVLELSRFECIKNQIGECK